MTTLLLGALVACAIAMLAEGYVIFGRMQLFLTAAEQILAALQMPLRDVATKSARRSIAPADLSPRRWFQTLRRLADVVQLQEPQTVPDPLDDELARWDDDGGAAAPTEHATTRPMQKIHLAGGARVRYQRTPGRELVQPVPQPARAPEEAWRDQFTFHDGGRRHRPDRTA